MICRVGCFTVEETSKGVLNVVTASWLTFLQFPQQVSVLLKKILHFRWVNEVDFVFAKIRNKNVGE